MKVNGLLVALLLSYFYWTFVENNKVIKTIEFPREMFLRIG